VQEPPPRGTPGVGSRFSNLAQRAVRNQKLAFLAVGGINTLLGFGLFVLFDLTVGRAVDAVAGRTIGSLVTLACSYAIAIVVAFLLHRRFVFKVQGQLWLDFVRFQSVYWLAITINAVALPILVAVGAPRIAAQAVIVVVTTAISWFGHRYFSFRRPQDQAELDEL